MRYLPKSPGDRETMLKAMGLHSTDDLFAQIPAEYRLNRDLKIPRQMAESEIVDYFRQRSRENGEGFTSFLGAGAYSHYRPVIIDSLISRGEFLTAYTPYQAEISQGTLQSIFEFQTMICELTGMEVANASMYDGSTAAAEAVMMAVRLTGRRSVVVARTLHPEYREVLATYATHQGMPVSIANFRDDGRVNVEELEKAITSETAAVLIQSPNFLERLKTYVPLLSWRISKERCWWFRLPRQFRWELSNRRAKQTSSLWRRSHSACRLDWRTLLRRDCYAGKIRTADAGKAGRADGR